MRHCRAAVEMLYSELLNHNGLFIHGPPGTGKSKRASTSFVLIFPKNGNEQDKFEKSLSSARTVIVRVKPESLWRFMTQKVYSPFLKRSAETFNPTPASP